MLDLRNLINLIVTFVVFWSANQYFSEYLSITDTKTLILATVFMFVIGYIFRLSFILSILTIPLGIGCLTSVILFFMAIILTPIKLWLLDRYLTGFDIHGFWTYVVITVVLGIFSIKAKTTKTEEKQ